MILLSMFLSLFMSSEPVTVHQVPLDTLRARYEKAVSDESTALDMITSLAGSTKAIEIAYRAAAEALMAKHAWNPYKKIDYLHISRASFEKAVSLDANNVEIRYLRLTCEHNIPAYLNMSSHITDDVSLICNNMKTYKTAHPVMAKKIVAFMLDSGRCTESQKLMLQ